MDKANLDTLHNKIIRLLTENGRMPIGEMAKTLNITPPVILIQPTCGPITRIIPKK